MIAFFRQHKWIFAGVFSLLGAGFLPRFYAALYAQPVWKAALVGAAFFAAALFLINRALSKLTDRLFWFSLIGGFGLGIFSAVGTQVYTMQHLELSVGNIGLTALTALCATPIYAAVLTLLLDGIPRWRTALLNCKLNAFRLNPVNLSVPVGFLLIWGVITLFWLPAYLGFFPGIWGYDMHNQTYQIFTHNYNNFQPLLHTLFYEVAYKLGVAVFKTATAGVAVFTLLQMLTLSACLSSVCVYMAKRLRTPAVITFCAVGFYALLPVHGILSVSSTKDTVFAGIFIVTLLQVYDLCMEPGAFFHKPLRILGFFASVAAICLLRNNTLYAVAFLIPFVVLGVKEKRMWIAGVLVCALILSIFAKSVLTKAVDAGDGRRIEMLSVPIQQVARAYNQNEEKLTRAEKDAVYEYLPKEVIKEYYPFLADPVKDHCAIGDGAPSIKGFLSVWLELLKKYPSDYVDAFLLMNLGYWYPGETFHAHIYDCYDEPDTEESLGYMYTGFVENINEEVKKQSLWSGAERYYNWFAHENGHERIPVFRLLFAPGFYCWVLYVAMLTLLYYKAYRLLWPLMLPLGVWLTLLLGPCLVVRYVYPIMVAMPLLLGVLFNGKADGALTQPVQRQDGSGRGGEVIRFAVSGGLGFVIDYGLMVLLKEIFNIHYLLAAGVSFAVSVVVNYLLCAHWVFRQADTKNKGVKLAFIVTSLIGLGLNELFMFLFVDALQLHYMAAKIVAVVLVMIWNYFSKRKVLTGKEKKTEETA